MDVMLIIAMLVLVATTGVLTILAFIVGVSTAQKAHKGETVKMPTVNPIKLFEEHEEKRMIEQAEKEMDIMLENINNYTGDGLGQKDIK